jgi:hypothetical protein
LLLRNQTKAKAEVFRNFASVLLSIYLLYNVRYIWQRKIIGIEYLTGKWRNISMSMSCNEWLAARPKRNMATKTVDLEKMSTKIFIVLSATMFLKNQGRVEIMITSFVLPASLNI